MRVQMIGSLTGMRNGARAPQRGDVIDVPDDEGNSLIAQGMAQVADSPAPAAPEAETTEAIPEGEQAIAVPAKARRARKATA